MTALESGRIAMAGLDAYRREPLPVTSRLRTLPNVVLMAHMGGGSYRWHDVDPPVALDNIEKFFSDQGATGIINASQ